jgi:solute carrier family 35 (adenosine 3'-phospho 5'-phosphosulfate transporter), member B2
MWNILVFSSATTLGQLFISYTIKTFGALLFATVMTTRQFLSILLSCFLFFHPLSLGQIAATLIVFGALYYKNLSSRKKESVKASAPVEEAKPSLDGEDSKAALERLIAAGK